MVPTLTAATAAVAPTRTTSTQHVVIDLLLFLYRDRVCAVALNRAPAARVRADVIRWPHLR